MIYIIPFENFLNRIFSITDKNLFKVFDSYSGKLLYESFSKPYNSEKAAKEFYHALYTMRRSVLI